MSKLTWILIIFGVVILIVLIASIMMFSTKTPPITTIQFQPIQQQEGGFASFMHAILPDSFTLFGAG